MSVRNGFARDFRIENSCRRSIGWDIQNMDTGPSHNRLCRHRSTYYCSRYHLILATSQVETKIGWNGPIPKTWKRIRFLSIYFWFLPRTLEFQFLSGVIMTVKGASKFGFWSFLTKRLVHPANLSLLISSFKVYGKTISWSVVEDGKSRYIDCVLFFLVLDFSPPWSTITSEKMLDANKLQDWSRK